MLVVLAIVFGCVAQSLALNYSICREWSGHDFYDQFFWFNYDDPTHGLVDYVDQHTSCLLYTSDAADDMQCVDLGGRRIIKKKFFEAEDGIRDSP